MLEHIFMGRERRESEKRFFGVVDKASA